MFVNVYIEFTESFDLFLEELLNKLEVIRKGQSDYASEVLICESFTLYVFNREENVKFKNEDYNKAFTILLNFELISNSNWAKEIMELAGHFLKRYTGSLLVEANGDIPLVYRDFEEVVVDEHRLKSKVKFPFESLNIEYRVGILEQL